MASSYDAIVIGTGQAGPTLAAELAGAGRQVAVVERHRFGGTCVNVGCTPTKTLVASARAAHVAHRAGDFGVVIDGGIDVDMRRVKARKDAIVGKSTQGLERWLKGLDNCTVYEGHARFEGPHRVRVGEHELEAAQIFINVGARAYVPPLPGLDRVDYLTNSGIMDLDVLPEHLVIIGGGYIGLEFAQMYRRFGSRVTLIEMGDRLIRREAEDVSDAVKEILEAEGVEVRLNAECISLDQRGTTVVTSVDCDKGAPEVRGHICCLPLVGVPTPMTSGLTRRASRSAPGAISVWTTRSSPACQRSGHSENATAAGRSPTPPTTTMKLWQRTCCVPRPVG